MKVYFAIDSERGVRDAFAKYHEELGLSKNTGYSRKFSGLYFGRFAGRKIKAEAKYKTSKLQSSEM